MAKPESSARMGSPRPTGFVPTSALAGKWGLCILIRRSIWPEAVWESPTTPFGKKSAFTRSVHKQNTKPEILGLHLTHMSVFPVGCWVTNHRVGRANPVHPLNFWQLKLEGRDLGAQVVSPGGTTQHLERLRSQPFSDDTQIHCLEAAAKEEC